MEEGRNVILQLITPGLPSPTEAQDSSLVPSAGSLQCWATVVVAGPRPLTHHLGNAEINFLRVFQECETDVVNLR